MLLTLGYEKRSIDEFIGILLAEQVDVVVDVRDVAWSHKRGFAKTALRDRLHEAGVDYVHAQFIGNPKRLRAEGGTAEDLITRYAHYLDANPALMPRFDDLIAGLHAAGQRVAIICFERDPAMCHRSIVAARWAGRATMGVRHLSVEESGVPA